MVDQLITDTDPKYASIWEYHLGDFDHTELWNCKRLGEDSLASVHLSLRESQILPDMIGNPLSWLIVSERLADRLKESDPNGIQLLNCKIESQSGKLVTGYSVVNVLNCLDVMDHDQSDYDMENGLIDMVYRWVFDARQIPDGKILFRESQFKYAVFSTRKLSLDLRGLCGMAFEDCEYCETS